MSLTRRGFLAGLLGAAGARLAGACRIARRGLELDELIDRILASSDATILSTTADVLARGATVEQVLAAAFVAPIVSGGDDEDVHAILALPSIAQLPVARRDRLVPVLWGVANVRLWARPRRIEPRAAAPIAGAPRQVLTASLRDGDAAVAEDAVVALVATEGLTGAAAALRWEASRQRSDPHGAIYAAQATRALAWLGAAPAAAVMRSVARYLVRAGAPTPDPPPGRTSADVALPAEEIAAALRADPDAALDGQPATWEALALLAAQGRRSDPSATGPGVHQTTLLEALWLAARAAPAPEAAAIQARAARWIAAPLPTLAAPPPADPSPLALTEIAARVARHGTTEHDFKYFAAAQTILPLLGDAQRSTWLAAMSLTHPVRSQELWPRAAEARALVADL